MLLGGCAEPPPPTQALLPAQGSPPSSPEQARRGFIQSRFQPAPISLATSSLSFPICMRGNDYIYSQ